MDLIKLLKENPLCDKYLLISIDRQKEEKTCLLSSIVNREGLGYMNGCWTGNFSGYEFELNKNDQLISFRRINYIANSMGFKIRPENILNIYLGEEEIRNSPELQEIFDGENFVFSASHLLPNFFKNH